MTPLDPEDRRDRVLAIAALLMAARLANQNAGMHSRENLLLTSHQDAERLVDLAEGR